jgi:D-psicose/D-tagatose/L-ribulose 3-epimerase
MQFGINTANWASPLLTPSEGLLGKVRTLGFDLVEINCADPQAVDVRALRDALAYYDLQAIVCATASPQRDLSRDDNSAQRAADYVRDLVHLASAIGAALVAGPLVAATALPATADETERAYYRSIMAMRELARHAEDCGVRLAVQPLNRFYSTLVNTTEEALAYCDEVGSPAVGLNLSTHHMHYEEKDSAAAVRKAARRLLHVHAAENDHGVPGTGQVHWSAVFQALRAVGYAGAVVIESFAPYEPTAAHPARIWRRVAPDQDAVAVDGLAFLREGLARR